MTGKRFKEIYPDIIRSNYFFTDNGEPIGDKEVCDLLNELYEEKEMWKRECERLKGLYYLENEKDEHLAWKRVDVE